MNKILFSLLLVSVSFGGIQEASAVRSKNEADLEKGRTLRNVFTKPLPIKKRLQVEEKLTRGAPDPILSKFEKNRMNGFNSFVIDSNPLHGTLREQATVAKMSKSTHPYSTRVGIENSKVYSLRNQVYFLRNQVKVQSENEIENEIENENNMSCFSIKHIEPEIVVPKGAPLFKSRSVGLAHYIKTESSKKSENSKEIESSKEIKK